MRTPQRWLIYALGSGWGHLNRAIALARLAPCPVEVLVNSRYAPTVQSRLAEQHVTLHRLPSTVDSPTKAQAYVKAWLSPQNFTHLVVDTFPRGLVGELAELLPRLKAIKILVHRDLTPSYIQAKALEEFVQTHYNQVLIPGEGHAPLAHLNQAHQTLPWLMRDVTELRDIRESLQERFRLPQHLPVIVVCATGQPNELEIFGEVTQQLTQHYPEVFVRCLAHERPPGCLPDQWIYHWPGLEMLQFADGVVGAAGYNTTYECAALGVPLVSLPMERKYDRQAQRAAAQSIPAMSIEDCIQAVGVILAKTPLRSQPMAMRNGVHEAIALISNLN